MRGMGFEPTQPCGNRCLKTWLRVEHVFLSLSPLARLGHPRFVGNDKTEIGFSYIYLASETGTFKNVVHGNTETGACSV